MFRNFQLIFFDVHEFVLRPVKTNVHLNSILKSFFEERLN